MILVPYNSKTLLFYLLPPPRNCNMSPRKDMVPKNKQKYTLKPVSKTEYSRSALEVKHSYAVFTLLYILFLNMRIAAARSNLFRGNSKKSPASPLKAGKVRILQLRGLTSSVVPHCPAQRPLNIWHFSQEKKKKKIFCAIVSHSSTDRFPGNADCQVRIKNYFPKKKYWEAAFSCHTALVSLSEQLVSGKSAHLMKISSLFFFFPVALQSLTDLI